MSVQVMGLQEWLHTVNSENWHWYIKRLSGNDTGSTGTHQVGFYIPNDTVFYLFPTLDSKEIKNPDAFFQASVDSHQRPAHEVRAVYYNNRFTEEDKKKNRNEARITRWKSGDSDSPLQNASNTGSLILCAFEKEGSKKDSTLVKVWVCKDAKEEELLEEVVGRIYPGENLFSQSTDFSGGIPPLPDTGKIRNLKIPDLWKETFPTGVELVQYTFDLDKSLIKLPPDKRLVKRRELEFKLFRQIEDSHLLPKISSGFSSVEDFIKLANSVSNRRKSRGGRSLELHLEQIFKEEGFNKFSTQAVTEGKKKPDFLFPSEKDYHNPSFPEKHLRMLAVKTTCKDRWRQVINEANRIGCCHLFTLQEGVSENQFHEMQASGVTLVVPESYISKYPKSVQKQLITLESFIAELKDLYA